MGSAANNGHLAVAACRTPDVARVTQNVDNCMSAGSSASTTCTAACSNSRCDRCQRGDRDESPRCPNRRVGRPAAVSLRRLIRPNVVWFANRADAAWERSLERGDHLRRGDRGAPRRSLPRGGLPELALASGTSVIEVNRTHAALRRRTCRCARPPRVPCLTATELPALLG